MNESAFLEKLLDGAEVEWVTLGDVAEIKRGTSITKKNVSLHLKNIFADGELGEDAVVKESLIAAAELEKTGKKASRKMGGTA